MKLGYIILYVPSVPNTLAFYEQAFGLTRLFMTPEEDYGELDTGATTLAFASEALGKSNGLALTHHRPENQPLATEVAWVTQDVEGAVDRALSAGATLVQPVTKKPWGQVVGYVRDLNGALIELCSPVSS